MNWHARAGRRCGLVGREPLGRSDEILGVGLYLEFRNNFTFYKDLILSGNRARDAPHWV
jgi:hypothetical protein